MPRMKLKREEFDPKALDVKVEKSKFKRYTGDVPRTGTVLIHRVTKMWWTQTEDGTSMIKALCVAEQNTGDKKKFNGLPTWAYLVFKPDAAFTYVPFLQCFGLTTRDIYSKMNVAEDADNIGDIIESLADWEVGSDDALCRIVVKNDREYGAKVDREGWLPLDEADEVDDDDEDEDDIEDDDEEEDEPPARPTSRARGRSSQDGCQAKSRRRAEPEPDEDEYDDDEDDEDIDDEEAEEEDEEAEDEEDEEEAKQPPARTKRAVTRSSRAPARAASATRSAGSSRSRPARDGSRTKSSRTPTAKQRGSKDDPPF